MRRVDVHAHHIPNALVEALRRRGSPPRTTRSGGRELVDLGAGFAYPLFPRLIDPEAQLEQMDRDEIEVALVSLIPVGIDALDPADAVALAREANDELASLPQRSSGRLIGLAALPMANPDAAVEELRRAAGLGLRGAQLPSNVEGHPLDDDRFRGVFETAAELDLPLVLHPTRPVDTASLADYALLTTLGFLYDTTTCAVRLVFSGVFERHPDLKLVLPHVGSVIPYILPRIDYETRLLGSWGELSSAPSDQLRRFLVDSVCLWPPALRLALEVFGADRVMFGSDEPFWRGADSIAVVEQLDWDELELERIYRENAERTFGPLVAEALT
jgi:predicted TIM-barrel fold metal-dependent hydrolase